MAGPLAAKSVARPSMPVALGWGPALILVTLVMQGRNELEATAAEEGIRQSEYKLRHIIETVPALPWSTGFDGGPTDVNQRMSDDSGMRFEDFKHRGWEAFGA